MDEIIQVINQLFNAFGITTESFKDFSTLLSDTLTTVVTDKFTSAFNLVMTNLKKTTLLTDIMIPVGIAVMLVYFLIYLMDKTDKDGFSIEIFVRSFSKLLIGYILIANSFSIMTGINDFTVAVVTGIDNYALSNGKAVVAEERDENGNVVKNDYKLNDRNIKETKEHISEYATDAREKFIDSEKVINEENSETPIATPVPTIPPQTGEAKTIEIPDQYGKFFTYELINRAECGYKQWSEGTTQRKLYEECKAQGFPHDDTWLALYNGYYMVAVTTTFGNPGDYLTIKTRSGETINAIIADTKSQHDKNCNEWGHDNGQSIVEFLVVYNNGKYIYDNPGNPSNHPEWKGGVASISNEKGIGIVNPSTSVKEWEDKQTNSMTAKQTVALAAQVSVMSVALVFIILALNFVCYTRAIKIGYMTLLMPIALADTFAANSVTSHAVRFFKKLLGTFLQYPIVYIITLFALLIENQTIAVSQSSNITGAIGVMVMVMLILIISIFKSADLVDDIFE